jgi:hypothetical protein
MVDSPSDLTQKIKTIAYRYGYSLQTDDKRINDLKTGGPQALPGEKYYAANDYLTGNNGHHNLTIGIIRAGSTPVTCSTTSTDYYNNQAPDNNKAILVLDFY